MIQFTRMHGLGNDYVLVDAPDVAGIDLAELARSACDRHTGIGADGLLVLHDSGSGPVGFAIINADGSSAELCGNGLRCAAALISSRRDNCADVVLESAVGRHSARIEPSVDAVWDVSIGLVPAELGEVGEVAGWEVHPVQVGNPHLVVFTESPPDPAALETLAMAVARRGDERNIHLVGVVERDALWALSWERGVGPTLACATGAAAALAAAHACGLAEAAATVTLPGGVLDVTLPAGGGPVRTRGSACLIAHGQWIGP